MSKISLPTVSLTLLLLKLSEAVNLEWSIVFAPVCAGIILALTKGFIKGFIKGIAEAIKESK